GPAAGPVGVAATVELELASHRELEPVLAGDGLVSGVRVTNHLDQLMADRSAGGQPFRPRHVLDRHARSGLADPQEGKVVIVAGRGFPGLVDVDLGYRPGTVRTAAAVVPGHELNGALGAGHAVRGSDQQVAGRAVDHARRAEVLAKPTRGRGEQRPYRRSAGERLAVP